MPFLSIIVTVYNMENYIGECIESIINQDMEEYELIIIDDGSSDKSVNICKFYENKYPDFIRFTNLPSPGSLGRAHRVGFNQARGKYIQVIDGDDFLSPNSMVNIINLLKKEKPDVLISRFNCKVESGAVNLNDATFDFEIMNYRKPSQILEYLKKLPNFHMVFVRYIFKKSMFRDSNLFYSDVNHTTTTNDWLPTIKILTKANSFLYTNIPFYNYRRRSEGSITSKLSEEHLLDHFITFVELIDYAWRSDVKGYRLEFIMSRIELMLKIAVAGYDLIGLSSKKVISELLEKNKLSLDLIKCSKEPELKELYKFIELEGIVIGFLLFCEYNQIRILKEVLGLENAHIYIFPCGIVGHNVSRILLSKGYDVKGYIDNDPEKHYLNFGGLQCYPVSHIKDNIIDESSSCLIISPLYEDLKEILNKQVINEYDYKGKVIIKPN